MPFAMDRHDPQTTIDAEPDCLGCRITGSVTLLGLSGYFLHERNKVPMVKMGERRWLLACSSAFALAGVYRATMGLFDAEKGSADADIQQST